MKASETCSSEQERPSVHAITRMTASKIGPQLCSLYPIEYPKRATVAAMATANAVLIQGEKIHAALTRHVLSPDFCFKLGFIAAKLAGGRIILQRW